MDPCLLPAGTAIPVGLRESMVLPSFDFETYSEAGFIVDREAGTVKSANPGKGGKSGLGLVGTPNYVEHPTFEVLYLSYNLKDGRGARRWVPGAPMPVDLLDYVAGGGLIEAWNITFEFWVWNVFCVRRFGWPPLRLDQCRCAMAKARRFSLPGSLDTAAEVLGTARKDPAGKALIRKLTQPHKATQARPDVRWTPSTAPEDFVALYRYGDQDVVAEDHTSALIPDLTPDELATWQLDQTINARGVFVDVETLDAALDILAQCERKYTLRLAEISGGAVGSVSEVAKFGEWLTSIGCHMPDMTADTVEEALKRQDLSEVAREALTIRSELGAANVKKLRTLKLQVSSDGRLRNQYAYCGADRTGRASAGGVQLQNITAKGPASMHCNGCGKDFGRNVEAIGCPRCGNWSDIEEVEKWTIEGVEQAIEDIRTRSLEHVEKVWGDAIAVLCGCLRGLFMAVPGKKFVCVDFSAIEAVVAACLSRCQWRIEVFSTPGECIYTRSASKITGTPIEVYKEYKEQNGSHHSDRKKIGKIAELASGYGGWVGAWKNFGCDMPDDEIKGQVLAWRAASPEIERMWGGQYSWCGPGKWDYKPELFGLEGAAIQAIQNPGKCFSYIDITYAVWDDVLYCRLPSGRFLHYHRPRLHNVADKLNRGPCLQITFEGYNTNSQKGPVGWHRMETYGGRLFENCVQAVAADIQFDALRRCEGAGYSIVMHTHDEGCSEVPNDPSYNVDAMAAIMTERPSWAAWWPIKAAGWEHQRYQKD